MDREHLAQRKEARKIIKQRLRDFYSSMKNMIDADAEDFYRRVMDQAESRRDASHP